MIKKYYAVLWPKNSKEEYVVRFRIKGSLKYEEKSHSFVDKQLYVRTVDDIIRWATVEYESRYGYGYLISREEFKRYRSNGIKRWTPEHELIDWD